ncbi:histone B2 [Actinidia rufa]|uniref:Histone B2 n=1 Tax=Actinidia rufa TaxID=165716 RepID=A0A7J0FHP5_9ERIC|nr:histone B2 [Actinidia rufa]
MATNTEKSPGIGEAPAPKSTEEKKTTVEEKVQVEKKPNAWKKLPRVAPQRQDTRRRGRRRLLRRTRSTSSRAEAGPPGHLNLQQGHRHHEQFTSS